MTKITRKLKALKKKISERHTDKPEENEPAIEKRIRKKTVRTEDPAKEIPYEALGSMQ